MPDRRAAIEGCLLGCAVGDSICLPYEGMSPRRVSKIIELPLKHRFFFGRGMVSDDTDHSIFVAQSLARNATDPDRFADSLSWRLRLWLLCLPAGIGMATLKGIIRLWIGISPSRSGVFSAGNGAAMRSGIIGVVLCDDPKLRRRFVTASTVITHSDPKADFGAQAIADLAAYVAREEVKPTVSEVQRILEEAGEGEAWDEVVRRTIDACKSGVIEDAVTPDGRKRGVSGYVYHTLPVAVAAWFIFYGDFRKTIETIAQLGGDTDTVAAIAGSLAGVSATSEGIPEDWITGIVDSPHSPRFISRLAHALSERHVFSTGFAWLLLPRGLVFTAIILGHGFRRLLPPY